MQLFNTYIQHKTNTIRPISLPFPHLLCLESTSSFFPFITLYITHHSVPESVIHSNGFYSYSNLTSSPHVSQALAIFKLISVHFYMKEDMWCLAYFILTGTLVPSTLLSMLGFHFYHQVKFLYIYTLSLSIQMLIDVQADFIMWLLRIVNIGVQEFPSCAAFTSFTDIYWGVV